MTKTRTSVIQKRSTKKAKPNLLVEVPAQSLGLPKEAWQWLGLRADALTDSPPSILFYLHQGHLCLAPSESIALLAVAVNQNIFRQSDGSFNRQAFCAVLGKSETEPLHDLEQLEELLLLVSEEVKEGATWGGVKTWLHHEFLGLGGQAPITFIEKGQWRFVSTMIYGNMHGVY